MAPLLPAALHHMGRHVVAGSDVLQSFASVTLFLPQSFSPAPQSRGYQLKLMIRFVLRVSAGKAISNKSSPVLQWLGLCASPPEFTQLSGRETRSHITEGNAARMVRAPPPFLESALAHAHAHAQASGCSVPETDRIQKER